MYGLGSRVDNSLEAAGLITGLLPERADIRIHVILLASK